jgi:hypothetical protein
LIVRSRRPRPRAREVYLRELDPPVVRPGGGTGAGCLAFGRFPTVLELLEHNTPMRRRTAVLNPRHRPLRPLPIVLHDVPNVRSVCDSAAAAQAAARG